MRLRGVAVLFATVLAGTPARAQGAAKPEVACVPQRPWEQDVGRAKVAAETLEDPVEQLTIRATPIRGGANLVLEWEHSRVAIPVVAAAAGALSQPSTWRQP